MNLQQPTEGRVALDTLAKTDMQQRINPSIFRAYDIRGIVGDTLKLDNVTAIADGIARLLQQAEQNQIIVGRDERLSSPEITQSLVKQLVHCGIDVIEVGVIPTPVLYFACHHLDCPNGVVVTASHNPKDYNGFKMVLNNLPLLPEQIQHWYHLCEQGPLLAEKPGHYERYLTINDDYVDTITQDIQLQKPLKVVIDCANGVTGHIAPKLFQALGCELVSLYTEVDGTFPNHEPDPSVIANLDDLSKAVVEHQADIGLAFDGDGDRVMCLNEQGEVIFPDYLLMLIIQYLAKDYPDGFRAIYDIKCTRFLADIIRQNGGKPVLCRTGHSFMKHKMREVGAAVGAEASGHVFWQDRWYGVDDGLNTAARVLEVLSQLNESISQAMSRYPRGVATPEFKLKLTEDKKQAFMQSLKDNAHFPGADIITIDGMRLEFSYGWGLIRVSNTSPSLTFRFEADNEPNLAHIQKLVREEILKLAPELSLPF